MADTLPKIRIDHLGYSMGSDSVQQSLIFVVPGEKVA